MAFKIRDPSRASASEHTEFLSRSERIWLFAEQHRNAVLIGLLLVCIVAAGIGGVFWMEHQHEQEALALEHRAGILYFDRPLDQPEKAKTNLEQATALYQQILDEFPHTSSAELAWYFLGNARIEQEKYSDAIEAYESYLSSFQNDTTLRSLVMQRLGSTYVITGNQQKGLEVYNQVLSLPEALNKDQVLFEMAKLEESDNHSNQALIYYKQLQDQHPASPYISEAALRIRVLEETQKDPQDDSGRENTPTVEKDLPKKKEE